jgi:uncharacterized repeat protein (TIGR01451 family)
MIGIDSPRSQVALGNEGKKKRKSKMKIKIASGSQTLFGNPPSRNSVSLSLPHAGKKGAKQSFADGVPKQSLGTRYLHLALSLLFLFALLTGTAEAQMAPPLPARGTSPLLFVQFSGGPGLRATFYQGHHRRSFDAPVVVGMRPGYCYRLRLSSLPGHPGVSIFPTVEVRGSLKLAPKLNAANYPAPVVLTEMDIESVLAGNLICKAIYLENPDRAVPASVPSALPMELNLPPGSDPLVEAQDRGRLMLLVRMGGRLLVSDEELCRSTVPGTILFPGEKVLMRAAQPPCLLWDCRPFYDPRLGPKPPDEECVHDGGDHGNRAGFDANGQLAGVEPEDTVAEYTDSTGRRHVTHSNCVCLCVPRFAALRCETPLIRYDGVQGVSDTRKIEYQRLFDVLMPPMQTRKYEQLQGARGRERPSINLGVAGTVGVTHFEVLQAADMQLGTIALLGTKAALTLSEIERARLVKQMELARELSGRESVQGSASVTATNVVGRIEAGARMVEAVAETRDLTVCCNEVPCPPDKPLVLIKCADRQAAQVGDVVTFVLKYSNHGGQPIADVAVTDSLTTRLEYLPGSAQTDRPAVFTTQPNEAGSLLLRWEIMGRLMPGTSGVVRFQARVR